MALYALCAMTACDYLDIMPDNVVTTNSMFADRYTTERYLATCYKKLPILSQANWNPALVGAMEMVFNKSAEYMDYSCMKLALSLNSASSTLIDFWQGNGGYASIRICNDFLEGIDGVEDLTLDQRARMKAEVTLIKAYLHFYLIKYYGPICPLRTNTSVNESTVGTRVYREKIDDCFAYVLELLQEVIDSKALPLIITNRATESGRFTQPAAYMLKARVLLYWASPLFNGNVDYNSFLNQDKEPFFNQEYDAGRWQRAAEACDEAIAVCTEANIRLYTTDDYRSGRNLSEQTKLVNTLRSAVTELWNSELIWAYTSELVSGNIQGECIPRLEDGARAFTRSALSLPFTTVNLFYTKHGLPIEQDKDYYRDGMYTPYKYAPTNEAFTSRYDYDYNRRYVIENETTAGMNYDREPRYYASVGFDRGVWYGNAYNDPTSDAEETQAAYRYPRNHYGEFSSVWNATWYNATGYWPKKLVSLETSSTGSDDIWFSDYAFPEMRYADLLLMAAEAWNEVESAPTEKVYDYLDQVRKRAGLEGVRDTYRKYAEAAYADYPGNKQRMREIIQRERKIELACEGQYYWDSRRWKTALKEQNRIIQGWNVLRGETADDYYVATNLFTQRFTFRDYFAPIPDQDIIRNPQLVQNPGW
jgi:hypothetical protein